MRRLLGYFKNYLLRSILGPFFKLSEAVFELIVPLVIAEIIDKGIPSADSAFIRRKVMLLIILAVTGFISAILAQYFAATASAGIAADIRRDLFSKTLRLTPEVFDMKGNTFLLTCLTSDINQIQGGINLFLRLLLRSPFIVAGAVIMAFTISPRMSLIFVAAVVLLGVIVSSNMAGAIPSYKRTREGLDILSGHASNGISGVKVIRGFRRTEDDFREFEEQSACLNKLQKKASGISNYLNPLTFLIINGAICILIYRGGINVSAGGLLQGQVVALYNYMSQILVELIKLSNLIISVSRAIACAIRVDLVFDLPEASFGDLTFDEPHDSHSLKYENVSYRYQGSSKDAVSGISFTLDPGKTLGIIGKTGSGKSTLAALAAGIYKPSEGSILIDDIPVGKLSRSGLAKAVGLCLQKTSMYEGSISYNISLGSDFVRFEDIEYAVKASCSDNIIDSKKEGLQYNIRQNGAGLSGGQKQRIGIARTLAGMPGLIILDDSTSALDAATEGKLLKNLKGLNGNPTVILISQKIRTVKDCDNIILMDEGKIIASGTHEQLIDSSSEYRELLSLQTKIGGVP